MSFSVSFAIAFEDKTAMARGFGPWTLENPRIATFREHS
jgi:hypothetical protein